MAADLTSLERVRGAIVACIAVCLIVSPAAVGAGAVGGGGTAPSAAGQQSIETGTEYEGTVGPNDSTDRYTFSAQQGEYVRVTTFSGSPDQVEATLYGPDGDRLGGHEVYVEHIGFGTQAPQSGQYTVEFTNNSAYQHDYRFEVETAAADDVGDTRSAAGSLGDSPARAVLGEGDEDYWAIDVPQAGEVSVDVDNERIIGAGVAVEVLSPGGEVLASAETNCAPGSDPCDIPELAVNADSGGEYYVHVVDAGVPGFNRYSISAETPEEPTETRASGEEPRRIVVSSDGERINYEFDVTGSIEPVDTDTEESVSGDHAEGVVVDGSDVFEFTGEVTSFAADGDPAVEVDGEAVDPDSFGGTAADGTTATPTDTAAGAESGDDTTTPTPTGTATATDAGDGSGDGGADTVATAEESTPAEGSGDAATATATAEGTPTADAGTATATADTADTATTTATGGTDAAAATTTEETSDDAAPSMPGNDSTGTESTGETTEAEAEDGETNGSIRDLDETTEGTTSGDGPGFGPAAALLGILAALGIGLARARTRSE